MISIIPAIDILEGKCVRLEQGDYNLKKVYDEDPLTAARRFEDNGIRRLHVVDLDGARDNHVVNYMALERIATKTSLVVDFGGGIKSDCDLKLVFDSGAKMAVIGSIAVSDRDLFQDWLFAYGPEKIILAADIRDSRIAVSGWTELTEISLTEFLRYYKCQGIKQVLCTDISKDGMMQGSSIDLYRTMVTEFPHMKIIASGGISSVDEIIKLNEAGVAGAIIGKALYEGKIKLDELKAFL
ncbi:MAG TPA: 1-(5-phosphoribosyl)-5-[(5-phosphoribosylamino)methylideneamino]imidazole-4-carboxamide isomerase [Bacteroidales bacterium]|jgi:phosphoribosylformimino-5-aminoimidazole carboxamide ribotide isomerase|nr:1-(5-phosphoribosyl)-5-[(5-phosphoribosylamino)methylideneamino]imidazole-4-carboxamide isomerase [Bacteroidales bacterium]